MYKYSWGEIYLGSRSFEIRYTIQNECLYSPTFSISIPYIFSVFIYLKQKKREGEGYIGYGFYFYDKHLVLLLGKKAKYLQMPWAYKWYSTELLDCNRKAIFKETAKEPNFDQFFTAKKAIQKSYPFKYILKNGETQQCNAAVCIERRVFRMNWLPWVKRILTVISVDFDSEIGEGSGSWKGGTMGCNFEILPEESVEECLDRMAREEKFD